MKAQSIAIISILSGLLVLLTFEKVVLWFADTEAGERTILALEEVRWDEIVRVETDLVADGGSISIVLVDGEENKSEFYLDGRNSFDRSKSYGGTLYGNIFFGYPSLKDSVALAIGGEEDSRVAEIIRNLGCDQTVATVMPLIVSKNRIQSFDVEAVLIDNEAGAKIIDKINGTDIICPLANFEIRSPSSLRGTRVKVYFPDYGINCFWMFDVIDRDRIGDLFAFRFLAPVFLSEEMLIKNEFVEHFVPLNKTHE